MLKIITIVLAIVLLGCTMAPSTPTAPGSRPEVSIGTGQPAVPTAAKRITMVATAVATSMRDGRIRPIPGLVFGGLTVDDEAGTHRAQLAEAVPTLENGLWKVLPEGRMETTWRLRDGVRWHDGSPLTADDLLFTIRVYSDKSLATLSNAVFDLIESTEVIDSRTVVVRWKQPYIQADALFVVAGMRFTPPLPRHLLEQPYLEDKATFDQLPYWTSDVVSSGPYRLKEWSQGSGATLEAFPDYALGRPRIDQVEVKFIPDPNTMLANLLAGTVDLTATQAVTIDQGRQISDQWRDGKLVPYIIGWTIMYPQLRAPNPPALLDPRFRRALLMGIDRQELADALTGGLAPVAESIIQPDQPEYPHVKDSIVRYSYDPARATQMIQELGFNRGADGTFRDGGGQPMTIEMRATSNENSQKTMITVADAFQRIGIAGQLVTIPSQGVTAEWDYGFTGFRIAPQDSGTSGVPNLLYGPSAPLPERGFRAPNSALNRGSYVNPEYDALMDRYLTTIAMPVRMQALSALVQWQTEQVLVFPLFYTVNAIMMTNRLQHAPPATSWNAHEWDVTA
jgi:peptide/nickel transport system substrate-binding protein